MRTDSIRTCRKMVAGSNVIVGVAKQELDVAIAEHQHDSAIGKATMTSVGLHNLCDLRLIDLDDWPDFFEDMRIDVEKECRKYGSIVKVWVDKTAPRGSVWLRFLTPKMAVECQKAMDKRCFAGRIIQADVCDSAIWQKAE